MDTDSLKTIEDAFTYIPQEVKEYIYSDAFIQSIETIAASQGFSAEQTTVFRGTLYGYIAQVTSEKELLECIRSLSTSPQTYQTMIDWIKTNVSDKLVALITEAYLDQQEADEDEQGTQSDSAQTVLSRLNQSFTAPTSIISTKTTYSGSGNSQQSAQKPVTDPYRLDPNEK